jgi:uncharacterized protein YerC/tetrahydromethanopterin S-methyltransferase subunit G
MADIAVVYPRIDTALDVLESELEATEVEAEAFRTFRSRLRRMGRTKRNVEAPMLTNTTTISRDNGSLRYANRGVDPDNVLEAYRDTVLAMAHYDSEYGEGLLENITLELGETVGTVLTANDQITSLEKGLIETAARNAETKRQQFVQVLTEERNSLQDIKRRLADVERRLDAVRREDEWSQTGDDRGREVASRLDQLAKECQALSIDRQQSIHRRQSPEIAGIEEESLVTYLYGSLEHQFPALVEVADVASRIASARS